MTQAEGPDNDKPRAEMLSRLEAAVTDSDPDFALEILGSQSHLEPVDLVEYMALKARNAEHPATAHRWEEVLDAYMKSLDGQELSGEDVDTMTDAVHLLQLELHGDEPDYGEVLEDIEPKTALAVSAEVPYEQDPDSWDDDMFVPRVDPAEMSSYVVFEHAVNRAKGYGGRRKDIRKAVSTFDDVEGEMRSIMRQAFDEYVFEHAVNQAKGYDGERKSLPNAAVVLEAFSSSESALLRMRGAFDKYVFEHAINQANGYDGERKSLTNARETVEHYASTPERRDAMLQRLGFA